VRAAAELFAAQGYTQTSIERIAARAGVAQPTVYTAFTGKTALFKEAVDLQLAGDDAPVPVRDRPWFQELLHQRDPRRLLELEARNDRIINERWRARRLSGCPARPSTRAARWPWRSARCSRRFARM
jgi:AcrR family transcriptional regulator